jgi:AraC family transcriptional regulator, transcriptional activator FtrA
LQLARLSFTVKIMPNRSGPLVVAILYDGLCTFEFGIVAEVFGLFRPEMGDGWYRFASAGIDPAPMRAHGGFLILPDSGPEVLEAADIIIVPGWKGAHVPVPESLSLALRRAHARGARLASICSGAFVLAATGLLSGGAATTHWRYADALRARHSDIAVDATSLYLCHDRIFTSAGSAAGLDLMIEIVKQDFGPAAANSVARRLVMPAQRTGGQAQFLERAVPRTRGQAISPLIETIRTDLAGDWPVERMAQACHMSLRTFLRRFAEATGPSPADWLVSERIEEAKRLLCAGIGDIETVAIATGFGCAHSLRHHFRRKIGLSPREFRARFLTEGLAV